MKRKEAFLRKGEKIFSYNFGTTYNRANVNRWYFDHTPEQMTYLWDHNYIEWSKPMVNLGECPDHKFIQFTKSGARWREWYEMSHWDWIKYHVLGYMFWKYRVYYPIRKHIFRKPYPWEGYEGYME